MGCVEEAFNPRSQGGGKTTVPAGVACVASWMTLAASDRFEVTRHLIPRFEKLQEICRCRWPREGGELLPSRVTHDKSHITNNKSRVTHDKSHITVTRQMLTVCVVDLIQPPQRVLCKVSVAHHESRVKSQS